MHFLLCKFTENINVKEMDEKHSKDYAQKIDCGNQMD